MYLCIICYIVVKENGESTVDNNVVKRCKAQLMVL